jgi:hypothetical protein
VFFHQPKEDLMADIRDDDYRDPALRDPAYRPVTEPVYVERRSGGGSLLGTILVLAIIVVALLFATGFWKLNVQGGSLPAVSVQSKQVVVGTKQEVVNVPTVGVSETPAATDAAKP